MSEQTTTYSLDTLLSDDKYNYEDEKLASNIYYVSFSTSINEIETINKTNPEKARELDENNKWLLGTLERAKIIPAINFDKLPALCKNDGLKSPDALLLNYNDDSLNLIIEFKNCSKRTLEQNYLNPKKDDSVHHKFADAVKLITSKLSIENYEDIESFISKTHIVVVYNGKNDTLSNFPQSKIDKITTSKNSKGKQNKAVKVNFSGRDYANPIEEQFSKAVNGFGYAKCKREYFPIPGTPKYKRVKSEGKVRDFSLFSSIDFVRLMEEFSFFDGFDYGVYEKYFMKSDKKDSEEICLSASVEN